MSGLPNMRNERRWPSSANNTLPTQLEPRDSSLVWGQAVPHSSSTDRLGVSPVSAQRELMNRSVPFVLWLIPIVFLVVELGDQGLLRKITFWFLLVVVCLFAARSLGIIGESSDRKEESLQPRSR